MLISHCFNRDFPSLGASAGQQNQSASQTMWSNSSIRAPAQGNQSIVSRTTGPTPVQQQLQDDAPHFVPGNESYRFGATNHQVTGLAQSPNQGQGGNAEDFPPLGGLGGDLERRGSLLSAFASQGGLGLQGSRLAFEQTEMGLRGPGDRNVRL
jgi:hypothetical protein